MYCCAERLNVKLIGLRVVHNSNKGMVNVCELWYILLGFMGFAIWRDHLEQGGHDEVGRVCIA